jgi:Beta-lactamase superfamily domain
VALSHLHADHFIDMCSFWVARTYLSQGVLRVPVYGPADTAARIARANDDPDVTGTFDFVTLMPGRCQIGPFTVTVGHVAHPVETFAFRFEYGGRVLAYSGDTGESPVLVKLARSADILLCEAGFPDVPDLPPGLHLSGRRRAACPDPPGSGLRPCAEPGRGAGSVPRTGLPRGARPGTPPGLASGAGPPARLSDRLSTPRSSRPARVRATGAHRARLQALHERCRAAWRQPSQRPGSAGRPDRRFRSAAEMHTGYPQRETS